MKSKLRRLQINEACFLWRVRGSVQHRESSEPLSLTQVTVYRDGCPKGGLEVCFTTWIDAMIGSPLLSGIPVSDNATAINLNQPSSIRRIIEFALARGWTGAEPMRLADGMEIFALR